MAETTGAGIAPEPMPQRPNPWQLLTAMNSTDIRWPGALRAALALFIPGALSLLTGHEHEMLLVAAGSCAVIYGEGYPYRKRWQVIVIVGALLTVGTLLGSALGHGVFSHLNAGGSRWWFLLIGAYTTALATAGVFVQNALRLPPPGVFFIIMASGGATMSSRLGISPWEVAAWTSAGALSALVVGMIGWLVHPHNPEAKAVAALDVAVAAALRDSDEASVVARTHRAQTALANAWAALTDAGIVSGGKVRKPAFAHLVAHVRAAHLKLAAAGPAGNAAEGLDDATRLFDVHRTAIPHTRPTVAYRIFRAVHPYSHATMSAARVAVASVVAAAVGIALGFDRPDWAVVSVVLIAQWGPDRIPGTIRAAQRFGGTVIGIGLFAALHAAGIAQWSLLIALAAVQFLAEIFVTRNYALTVIVTTPLALYLGGAVSRPLGEMVVARFVETVIAVVCALIALWAVPRVFGLRHYRRLVRRSLLSMGALLGALLTATPAEAIRQRRDLQYELLSERRAIQSLAADFPDAAAPLWDDHLLLQRTGYALLDYCTAHVDDEVSLQDIEALAATVRKAQKAL